jgi:hypothetical protein
MVETYPLESLRCRVKGTGGDDGLYIFRHLVLTEEESRILGHDLPDIADFLKVNFISVQRSGSVSFQHITDDDNLSFILDNGLMVRDDGFVSDLGRGIYGILLGNTSAEDHLRTYIGEEYESDDDEILIFSGFYTGPYLECIYGEQHVGYLVLLTDCIPLLQLDTVKQLNVMDYLMQL